MFVKNNKFICKYRKYKNAAFKDLASMKILLKETYEKHQFIKKHFYLFKNETLK